MFDPAGLTIDPEDPVMPDGDVRITGATFGVIYKNIESVLSADLSEFKAADADAGGPYVINEGDSLNLNASLTPATNTQITSVVWIFPDGEIEVPAADLAFDAGEGIYTATTTLNWDDLVDLGLADDGQYDHL
ncbi:hypothetical protein ES703_120900 [subsurface metagenome]